MKTFYLAYSKGCESVALMTDVHDDHSSWTWPFPMKELVRAFLSSNKTARVVIVDDCADIEGLAVMFSSFEELQQQSIPLERFCSK